MGIKWQDGVTVSEAVISMDTVSRHIKRQEKKCDSLMVNLKYTIPEIDLTFKYYRCKILKNKIIRRKEYL